MGLESKDKAREAEPPIDVDSPRYDQSTFSGRLKYFIRTTSPLTLLHSNQEIRKAQSLLRDYKAGERTDLYDKPELVYQAQNLVNSSVHPDSGEIVPLPFRMSAFVPTNLVAVGFMLTPNLSTVGVIASQWLNQSLNCAVNYCNANKSSPMSTTELATAYISATVTSVTLAVGLNSSVGRMKSLSAATQALAKRFVPFVAVAAAGAVNVSCMRYKELFQGIPVWPPAPPGESKPETLGNSATAGRMAVGQTIASRILTNVPTMVFPPVMITLLQRRGYFKGPRGGRNETLANLGLIGAALLVALPAAIATFPQTGSIDPNKLENQFHGAKDLHTGQPLSLVHFSKGL